MQKLYKEIHNIFKAPNTGEAISYFNMLGLLTISLGDADKVLSDTYNFKKEDVTPILPSAHILIPSDYSLTPVGIVLAIFNAHSKWNRKFNLTTWIHE